jgi:hypothetical protein
MMNTVDCHCAPPTHRWDARLCSACGREIPSALIDPADWRAVIAAASKLKVAGRWQADPTPSRRECWVRSVLFPSVRTNAAEAYFLEEGRWLAYTPLGRLTTIEAPSIGAAKADADAALREDNWILADDEEAGR